MAALLLLAGGAAAREAAETPAERADRLASEVGRLLEEKDFAAALERHPAALAAREAALSGQPLALADAIDQLAGLFYNAPEAPPEIRGVAETLLLRALELRRSVPGEGDVPAAETLQNLATFSYLEGRWQKAEERQQEALAIFRRRLPEDDPRVANSLGGLGFIYYQQGRYGDAEPLIEQSVALLDRVPLPDPFALAQSLNALAELYRAQGRYEEAEKLFRRALSLARESGDDAFLAEVLNNFAGVYRDQSRYADVEPLFDEIITLRKKHADSDPGALGLSYLNRADIHRLQGRYAEAEDLAAKGLEIAGKLLGADDPDLAWYYEQVALVATETGKYGEARRRFDEALAIVGRTLPEDHPQTAQMLNDFARMLRLSGSPAEAEEKYRRALAIRRKVYGDRHPETASTLAQLARCAALQGEDGRALELAEEALGVFAGSSVYPDAKVDALALKAEILKRRGETAPALAALDEALAGVEGMRPHTGGDEGLRAEFLSRYVGYFHEMVAWQVEAGLPGRAFETAERGRARVLLDQLAEGRVDLRRGIPAGVLDPLERRRAELKALLGEARQRLAALPQQAGLSDEERRRLAEEQERQIETASREQERVLNQIRNASPLWLQVITASGRPISAEAAQRELVPAGGLLLLYQVGRDGGFLFMIPPPPAAVRAWPLSVSPDAAADLGIAAGPFTAGKLEEILSGSRGAGAGLGQTLGRTRGLTEEMPAPAEPEILARRLHALWRVLVPAELWPRLRRASEAIVVPDGGLHRLPFEALVVRPGPGAVRYWLDEGPVVRYAPSATTLYNLRRRATGRSAGTLRALIISDPLFDRRPPAASGEAAPAPSSRRWVESGGSLARLPGTAREAEAIRKALSRGGERIVPLAGPDAEEARVREELRGRPRYLHFATHGLVDDRRELLAALALTPPLTQAPSLDNDGLLQLFEIYQMDLDCALVVLSACATQTGRQLEGEGVFALSRGFLAAGAQRVVASLWPVDDDSTAFLMGDFYRRIGGGTSHARALRDARRSLRRQPRWADPYFWAPFVLSGTE